MPTPQFARIDPQAVVTVRRVCAQAEIGAAIQQACGILGPKIASGEILMAGPPFARYLAFSAERVEMDIGAPVAKAVSSQGEIQAGELPGGRAVTYLHTGPYESLHEAWRGVEAWIKEQGLSGTAAPWEVYLTDPSKEPDAAKYQTQIVWPVA
ncbi:MAG: GyrI-like domain-containing protein [Planctomycetota bacterium]|nr:GyrI-like domain-containing protein [Planctomycetota bacterium]